MKDTIKKIIIEEFSKLTKLIEDDFAANYKRKVNNFLLKSKSYKHAVKRPGMT